MHPSAAFSHATSGAGGAVPHRAEMEASFGQKFSDVSVHAGTDRARQGLASLGARAATRGRSVAFKDSSPTREVVAHELAHVVQQERTGATSTKNGSVSSGGPSERAADRAAESVCRGEPVQDLGSAEADIQRMPETYGGEWTPTAYTATNTGAGVGKGVGAHIDLHFDPGELVFADAIGLIQTVKTLTNTAADPALNQTSFPAGNKSRFALDGSATEPDLGRAIDQGDGGTPNTTPLYAVEEPAGQDSSSLTDHPVFRNADPSRGARGNQGFGHHGFRRQNPDGTVAEDDAVLNDTPNRTVGFAGQQWRQTFEVAALCLTGPMAGTYLGSVEWGWQVDAAGNCTLNPNPVSVVSMGAPSSNFMAAAEKWNDIQLVDSAGNRLDTVDVPLTSHTTVDPATLSDAALHRRMRVLADEILRMNRTSTDYQQKRFEIRGLAQEVLSRGAGVVDSGHTYTVLEGDTLWGISSRHLGRGSDWTKIMALNAVSTPSAGMLAALGLADLVGLRTEAQQLMVAFNVMGTQDPNLIYPGQVLRMPQPYVPAGP
jgi:LysM repeat protein